MTSLAAPIWTAIAKEQTLRTEAAKVAFRLDDQQLAEMETLWMKLEEAAGTPRRVVRCLSMSLPLVSEAQAIQAFRQQHPQLNAAIPDVTSPEDVAGVMAAEWHLNVEEARSLRSILASPAAALSRWLEAAKRARQAIRR